jgi:diguanylate cyclase (GGDEF)-like protein
VTGVNGLVENLVSALRRERELGDLVAQDQRRTRAAAETADTGLFVVGADGGLEAWTPAFLRLLGLEQAPPVRGAALAPLFGASRVQVDQSLTRCRAIGAQVMERVAVPGPQPGQQRQLQLCLELAEADRVQGQVEDVTPLVEAPAASAGHALRDPLTGLPNRLGAEEVLTELLAANRDSLALVLVDLDQFKQANANYGARGGDEVLRQTAARIAACLRRSDLAARFGGDEFLLILNAVAEEQQVLKIARKVQDAVGEPMTLPGLAETWVSASVGIVLRHPGGNPSRLNLLKRAEQALDQAKLAGENQVRVYRG